MGRIIVSAIVLYVLFGVAGIFSRGASESIPMPIEKLQNELIQPLEEAIPRSVQQDILCDLVYLQERAAPEQLPIKPILRTGYDLFQQSQHLYQSLMLRVAERQDTSLLYAWADALSAFRAKNEARMEALKALYPESSPKALEHLKKALIGWPDSLYLHHPKRNAIALLPSITRQETDEEAKEMALIIGINLLMDTSRSIGWLANFAESLYGDRLEPELRREWILIRQQLPLLLVQE